MTNATKKYKKLYKLYQALSLICLICPLLIYGVIGFANGEPYQKLCLGSSIVIAGIMVACNLVFKIKLRSIIWVIVLGIYICLKEITLLLVIVAITTLLDELLFTPLKENYKSKFKINKEIDVRLPVKEEKTDDGKLSN